MSTNYFDQLEAELRAAVPRVTGGRIAFPRRRRWWLSRLGGLGVVISLAVTATVVVLFAGLLGHRQAASRAGPPATNRGPSRLVPSRNRGAAPGEFLYPLGAVPTLPQLLENFAVLRRPQAAQDHSWQPQCGCGGAARQLRNLTRFAVALPGGYRVFLDVEQLILGGQLNMAAGSYVLNLDIVDPHGNVTSTSFGPNTQFTLYPLTVRSRPGPGGPPRSNGMWASVVPDGVASVSWTFSCQGGTRARPLCAGVRSQTVTVPVVNNVAAEKIVGTANCLAGGCVRQVTWRSSDGSVVASFGGFGNLPAPPFVEGSQGNRVLHVLLPSGVGSARLGQASSAAIQTITQLLGAPADANVRAGGCGIDHESVWTSPAVADPLTIFQRQGHFVGYQYGAPVNEIGLRQGPGAVLGTSRGLTLDDTIAVARRLYATHLVSSAIGGGTWRVTADGGILRGYVLPTIYPLRVVTAKNPIATIEAGQISCPANTN